MTKQHILIVDDCEDVRFLLTLKLSNLGYFVTEAADGMEAMEILNEDHEHEISLILLDVMMPKISGSNLLYKLKESCFSKDIKIICITANYDELLHRQLVKLGAVDVVKKPIKGNELNNKIKETLNLSA